MAYIHTVLNRPGVIFDKQKHDDKLKKFSFFLLREKIDFFLF
jgi:hypothetical protein